MTIEVRQLKIQSSVLPSSSDNEREKEQAQEIETMKADILSECRHLIMEILQEKRER